ncbi:MAG: hypothetical protein IMZ64_13025 [Bacteroidetes bacterium]|nr:hypothetical protein [Bacteroidota bacterium]
MNKKIKVFGKQITIRKPEPYADIRDALITQIAFIAVIMLVLSYVLSFSLALIFLKEHGTDLGPMWKGIGFWVRLPITFFMLIMIALTSAAMDEIQKKRDKERYSKPLI